MARKVNAALQKFFADRGLILVDFKLEIPAATATAISCWATRSPRHLSPLGRRD